MNFKGAFLFLHIINPLAIAMYYLIYVNEKKTGKLYSVLFTPILVIAYLLIDYLRALVTGEFVYGFFKLERLTLGRVILVGVIVYLTLLAIGYFMFVLKLLIRKRKSDNGITYGS